MNLNAEKAVVLMNLGSPDSPEVKDVRRYLNEFLMDNRVIDKYSYLFRLLLVKGIIVPFRAPKSAHAYKTIWTNEGSPLIVISKKLKEAVQAYTEYPVEIAMRYANPSPKAAFDKLAATMPNLKEVILVPMYPHYAMSSFETGVVYAQEIHAKESYSFQLNIIAPYYNKAEYINAMSANIAPYLQQDYNHILFSFHGIPERHLAVSDPTHNHCLSCDNCCKLPSEAHKTCYRHQCLETMNLVMNQLNIPKEKYSYAFQSRLGREPWLKPYTDFRLADMPKEGIKKLLILCPAFVSDCLETLEEIEMRGKEIFIEAGGETYQMIPCMNVHPEWVKAVASWLQ
ncbi:MAG: ferrochelatase [Phycisphaerales bacterium]|nr:ferrochelatase [Phycisphaerales bacterium]